MRVGERRAFDEPVEEQSTVARAAAVEAEGELVEVVVEVLVADRALVGPSSQRLSRPATRWTSGIATWAGSSDSLRLVMT